MSERKAAREVVERLNKNWVRKAFNLQIELMGWEETIGTFGRPPQENIDADLAKCELFIGMLWYEWGSANTGKYESGFEHEFRLAEYGHASSGRPEICLMFKQVDERRPGGAGPGYERIKGFKEEIRHKVLWHQFADDGEFRDKLESILSDYVVRLHQAETRSQPQAATADSDGALAPTQPVANEGKRSQLPREALTFLHDFADQAAKDVETRPLTPVEIARLRLVGTLINGQGNDEAIIGVHDANTLFAHADELALTQREYAELAECGLANFDAQNTPYWRWLVAANGFDGTFIPLRTVFGSEKLRIGVFKLMRLMRMDKFDSENFDREFYVGNWLAADTHQAVRVAALGYLSEFGTSSDLPEVRAEIDRADYQTLKVAIHAHASILARESVEMALQALVDHQSDSVEDVLLDKVFARPEMLSAPLLEQALSHRAANVRRRSAAELLSRKQITREATERLLTDSEPVVRLQGLLGRVALGDSVSQEDAKALLVKRRVRSGFNYLATLSTETDGDAELSEFLRQERQRIPRTQIKDRVDEASIFEQDIKFEAIRRAFKSRGDELRDALRDGFASWFEKELAAVESLVGKTSLWERTKNMEASLRKEWTREALAIVLDQSDCRDLPLVRALVAADDQLLTGEVVRFLGKCGEWADTPRIVQYSGKPTRGIGLLGFIVRDEDVAVTTAALLRLGKGRPRDLLALEVSDRIKTQILIGLPASQFEQFADDEVVSLFRSDDEGIRRAAVLKVVGHFTLARIQDLMKRHLDPVEKRFYNIGVWLDLGVSLERKVGKAIARRAANFGAD